jgi:kynurenine formamidase
MKRDRPAGRSLPASVAVLSLVASWLASGCAHAPSRSGPPAGPALEANALFAGHEVVDLTVLLSETLPGHWGTYPAFQRWTYNWFTPGKNPYGTVHAPSDGPFYGQRFVLDEHTGTQTDFPAHFLPPPGSGLPHAGPMGALTGDKYPMDRMMGPAVVINVTDKVDAAENGKSALITVADVQAWERKHGEIRAGEVVLFHSGYTDKYYKPMPEGLRMTHDVIVTKTKPGWPAPVPEVMTYLRGKGVWHLGTDGPSMGPAQAGQATHVAGLELGMAWEEMLVNLGKLPPRGSFYVALPIKIVDQSGSPTRAVALVPRKP